MKWIKERLDEIGRRPIELARALGLPPARAYEMITGKRRVQPHEIARMSAFLDWPESHIVALIDGRATSKAVCPRASSCSRSWTASGGSGISFSSKSRRVPTRSVPWEVCAVTPAPGCA